MIDVQIAIPTQTVQIVKWNETPETFQVHTLISWGGHCANP